MDKKEVIRILKSKKATRKEITTVLKDYWKQHGSSYQKALDIFFVNDEDKPKIAT